MSPITDSRWAEARRKGAASREADESAAERKEWLAPLSLLVCGMAAVIIAILMRESDPEAPRAAMIAALYPVGLAIQVAVGLLGLWLACTLWLGGAGPLGLGLLRLAGIYAVYDAIVFAMPFPPFSTIAALVVYIALLVKLFELEAMDAILLVIITWVLKLGVAIGLVALLAGL